MTDVALIFLSLAVLIIKMVDLSQVDATLNVMAQAVTQLRASMKALEDAKGEGDAVAVAEAMARLKAGTDALDAMVSAAR